jgi:formamidase
MPIQMVGTGANLNEAVNNGVARLADLLEMSAEAVQNRVTLSGGVEIGRLPGVVAVTMLAPLQKLEELGLAKIIREQYGL